MGSCAIYLSPDQYCCCLPPSHPDLLLLVFSFAVAEQELVWANSEENPNFFTLFGKLSELQWICNDATESMAKKV